MIATMQPGIARVKIEVPPHPVDTEPDSIRIVKRRMPWDLRAWRWCERQIGTPHRIRRLWWWCERRITRLCLWIFRIPMIRYPRARDFLIAVFGPRLAVVSVAYRTRQEICSACEYQTVVRQGKSYCSECHCGRWYMSRLRLKNRFARWRCPKRKHPGTYPSYGCVGCGGGPGVGMDKNTREGVLSNGNIAPLGRHND